MSSEFASQLTPERELLERLGLFESITNVPKLDDAKLKKLTSGQTAFDWIHLGTTDLRCDELVAALRGSASWLSAPRTGHIGNWSNIAAGRAGVLDYNRLICRQLKLGHPLIYDLNQTEDERLARGDWIYLPGSIVDRGVRAELALRTWDGRQFVRRARDLPLLTPFVCAEFEGELVPLSVLHRERMRSLAGWHFTFQADVMLDPRVPRMLETLVETMRSNPDPQRALRGVFDRSASLDGTVERGGVRFASNGLMAGDSWFATVRSFVEAALLPMRLASGGPEAMAAMHEYPQCVPLLSAVAVNTLYALVGTHRHQPPTVPPEIDPHLHWGAIGMAGHPPEKHGYFREKTGVARTIASALVSPGSGPPPVFYVLIPVAPFLLWPPAALKDDLERIEVLISDVHRASDSVIGAAHAMKPAIEKAVEGWLVREGASLSPYVSQFFTTRRSVLAPLELCEGGELAAPEGFGSLTLRQACMIIGALMRAGGQQ